MTIIGVVHSKGNYQGNDYDNINFQCFSDVNPKGLLAGTAVETVKVKSDVVIDCVGKSIKSIDWNRFIGSDIICQYNKFGQVLSFSVNFQDGGTADLAATTDGPAPDSAISEVLADKSSKDNEVLADKDSKDNEVLADKGSKDNEVLADKYSKDNEVLANKDSKDNKDKSSKKV